MTIAAIFTLCAAAVTVVFGREAYVSGNSDANHTHTNHLINENSPYLLSHAHNPVDWHAWGEDALAKAKVEDKPIFLSIGYAACHWCHVMERESFEDESIAAWLNEHFVSIKVDREQRPDLDHIYMTFTQAMSGSGGWPMSVFLTPDLKPFFAGTYFPPASGFGRPSFRTVITEIAQAYQENKAQVVESAESIAVEIAKHFQLTVAPTLLTPELTVRSVTDLMRGYDPRYGGFGNAPKFPHATEWTLILRQYKRTGDMTLLQAVEKVLKGMACGGLNDQLGGGFARYSVDEKWLVPHFEKMLYDNALLVPLYADAYQVTGKQLYLNTVRQTLDFILRELADSSGGFYSALDADSEGEEGRYYVWSRADIEGVLGEEAELFCAYYNVTAGGNFEGRNILSVTPESDRILEAGGAEFEARLTAAREKLFEHRSKRVRPLADDKILTSWNGLNVIALARGYGVTGEPRYLDAARKNATFVREVLFRNNQLTHSYREGARSSGQFLEDYGYYLAGLTALYQVDPSSDNSQWLELASQLADRAIALFMDHDGSLYIREADQPDLIMRPREETDGARPSPGSVLLGALMRLGRLTGNNIYSAAAERGIRAISGLIARQPGGMASALLTLDYFLGDKVEIVIVGGGELRDRMLQQLHRCYLPNALVATSGNGREPWPLFEGRADGEGLLTAYFCRNSVCRLPVTTADAFAEELARLK